MVKVILVVECEGNFLLVVLLVEAVLRISALVDVRYYVSSSNLGKNNYRRYRAQRSDYLLRNVCLKRNVIKNTTLHMSTIPSHLQIHLARIRYQNDIL